ncbi:uncharacterized protein EV420DRAFT_1679925 [Desarmillaria tabescens]|uniref:Tc1-like transposase DDE domain-containing protein n=1 Tax=Armillaria tabescens TaxID=1929756 RepID=A0AA39MI23_ARMTA|nr:uncharacterized protein EV420DRAFT_1679925 [Desarmillaria tabescens]KAK0435122.1 hypothetical protein EV420DRAFT_1679925 [Desarmillaria tabescens]
MGNHHIPTQIKDIVLELWTLGWELSDICHIFHVSPSSLYHWRNLFETFGTPANRLAPFRGRPRIVSLAALDAIHVLLKSHPDTYLGELQWYLAIHHDLPISISALQQNLVRAGLTRKDEQRRAVYLAGVTNPVNFSGTGFEFVTVDESSKDERTFGRHYGRSPIGQEADLGDVFVRGERYSLIAAMSIDGYIATRVQPGSFDSFGFFDFIIEDVLPLMNPYPEKQSVLVMDNCRIHHTDTLIDVLNASHFSDLSRCYDIVSSSLFSRPQPD